MSTNDPGNYSRDPYSRDQPPQQSNYSDPLPPTIPPFTPESQGEKLQKKRINGWKIATQVLFVLVVILATSTAVLIVTRPNNSAQPNTATTKPQPTNPGPISTSAPTATQPTTTGTPSLTPTVQLPGVTATSYSALQPGPSCDANGGTWTPQGLTNITCGTNVSVAAANIRGYLFLQLPNGKAFSSDNKIGVLGSPASFQCIGLDEQNANTGFLAEYCGDGHWSIYTISSDGTIVQTLDKNLTSTRTNVDIALTLKGSTLSFSIDNEVHPVNSVSPIQPTKVAITYFSPYTNAITTNNFSYAVLSN